MDAVDMEEFEKLQSENVLLRTALEDILDVCQDHAMFVAMGPRAFAKAEQIALKALGRTR